MQDCIFCKIVKGEIPNFTVFEDEEFLAFLTIQPVKEGHTLLIPKKHTDYLFDLPDSELSSLMIKAKLVADKLKKVFNPKTNKVGLVVAGTEVAHVHVHLIPMDAEDDLDPNHKKDASLEELKETLARIQKSDF
jgi:histidine triad (HIT) family protein